MPNRVASGATQRAWLVTGVAALVLIAAAGCRNSILRNFTEAGLETALEDPLPTPTARR
jgi:hypothetical protein